MLRILLVLRLIIMQCLIVIFFCGILGYPHSGGVHVECGWASANGKKMYLFLEEGRGYSPMITGLGSVTDVTYCTYQDLNNELVYSILDIIKKENK